MFTTETELAETKVQPLIREGILTAKFPIGSFTYRITRDGIGTVIGEKLLSDSELRDSVDHISFAPLIFEFSLQTNDGTKHLLDERSQAVRELLSSGFQVWQVPHRSPCRCRPLCLYKSPSVQVFPGEEVVNARFIGTPTQSPLHVAAAYYNFDEVKRLVGADNGALLKQDEEGNTPLHLAALNIPKELYSGSPVEWERYSCVHDDNQLSTLLLLMNKAPEALIAQDNEGNTPLHLAMGHCNIERIKLLINTSKGMQAIKLKNKQGQTPVDLAISDYRWACTQSGKRGAEAQERSCDFLKSLLLDTNCRAVLSSVDVVRARASRYERVIIELLEEAARAPVEATTHTSSHVDMFSRVVSAAAPAPAPAPATATAYTL